jgi:hypothetical protein
MADRRSLLGLVSMQLLYWTRTDPASKFWLQNADKDLGNVGEGVFAFELMGPPISQTTQREMDWRKLRDRWEYSHVARAGVAFISFISLLIAIVLSGLNPVLPQPAVILISSPIIA